MRVRRLSGSVSMASMGLLLAILLLAAGCGSKSSTSSNPSPSPSPTSASAAAQIKANWETFFAAATPVAQRVGLLQNGQQFATVIQAQANSPLAQGSSAKVTAVTVVSPTKAKVTYSILLAGQSSSQIRRARRLSRPACGRSARRASRRCSRSRVSRARDRRRPVLHRDGPTEEA